MYAGRIINDGGYTHQRLNSAHLWGESKGGREILVFAEHLLCMEHCSKYVIRIYFLNPHNGAWEPLFSFMSIYRTEAQRF